MPSVDTPKALDASWFVPLDANDGKVARRRSRRRGEILAMTAKFLGERGYTNTSLDDVAEQLDFSKASLYHYFESKEALVHVLLRTCHEYVVGRLQAIAGGDGTAEERLRALVAEMVELNTSELQTIIRLFLHPVDWPPALAETVRVFREENDSVFRGVVEAGVATGEFAPMNATVSRLCMQGALSFIPDWYNPRAGHADTVVETLLRLFVVSRA